MNNGQILDMQELSEIECEGVCGGERSFEPVTNDIVHILPEVPDIPGKPVIL